MFRLDSGGPPQMEGKYSVTERIGNVGGLHDNKLFWQQLCVSISRVASVLLEMNTYLRLLSNLKDWLYSISVFEWMIL